MDEFQIHIMEEHIAAGLPDGEQLEKFASYLCAEGLAVSMLEVTHTMKTLYTRIAKSHLERGVHTQHFMKVIGDMKW